jgi:hypothetical protein
VLLETLWAADGRGAVITTMPDTLSGWPPSGPLSWLPIDGGPVINLPAEGWHLVWG